MGSIHSEGSSHGSLPPISHLLSDWGSPMNPALSELLPALLRRREAFCCWPSWTTQCFPQQDSCHGHQVKLTLWELRLGYVGPRKIKASLCLTGWLSVELSPDWLPKAAQGRCRTWNKATHQKREQDSRQAASVTQESFSLA